MTNDICLLAKSALQDADWRERRRAARILGKHPGDESKDALLQVLHQEHDADVLQATILSLVKLGSKEMLELITKPKIMMAEEESVRWACAHALGAFGYVPSFEQIFRFVHDPEWTVRHETISTLERFIDRIGQDKNMEPAHFEQNILLLIRMMQIDNAGLQDRLISCVGQFDPQMTEPYLLDALGTEHMLIKTGLIRALGNMKSKISVSHLIPLLDREPMPVVKAAIEALGKIGGLQAVNALIGQLSEPAEPIIRAAMEGLIRQKSVKFVEDSLIDALCHDTNTRRKKCILAVMGEIKAPAFRRPIFNHLGNSYFLVRKNAAEALLKYGEEIRDDVSHLLIVSDLSVEDLLKEARHGATRTHRLNAIQALGMVGNSEALPCLEELSQGEDLEIADAAGESLKQINLAIWARANAAFILGELGGEKSIEPLQVALEDASSRVRWAAITALRQVKSARTVDSILHVAENEKYAEIKREAVQALGDISLFPDRAKKLLFKAARDESPLVRQEAARVLGRIHDEPSMELLFECLEDSSFEVRRNALNALYSTGKDAIPRARSLLSSSRSSSVKAGIMHLLGMLYVKEAIPDIDTLLAGESDPELIAIGRQILAILNGKPESKKILFD